MLEEVKQLLGDVLQLGARAEGFDETTVLLGNLPELDSMAVVTLIAAMEDNYGFVVEDDEISADTFATLGALTQFVEEKSAQ